MADKPNINNLDQFMQLSTALVPANLNPKFYVALSNNILGSYKIYNTLEELVNLHPNVMLIGNPAIVNQHERTSGLFTTKEYKLNKIPELSDYPLSLDSSDPNYFENFWQVSKEFQAVEVETVFEYSSDINGLKPPYPYIDNPSAESSWSTVYDPATSKWLRSRTTSVQFQGTSIYKGWTIPLPISGNFVTGDYTDRRFIRSATPPSLPPSLIDGLKNNEPSGFSDTPPVGTDPLYEIKGQKDIYGDLKSPWIGPFLILEDEDLIRYNSNSTPNPNSLVNTTTSATSPSQANTDLINAGWVKTFDPKIHFFRAIREENSPNDYTSFVVDKISGESGEYRDKIYKLFPVNTDFDDPTFIQDNTPTGNDPISNTQNLTRNEGWSDTEQNEGDATINCYSEVVKFNDGSLKTPWSPPKPFTGKSSYIDLIKSGGETSFKYSSSEDVTPIPSSIDLTALLYKGNEEIVSGITYQWTRIYNNGSVDTTDFGTTKSITINPSDVDSKAVFRCVSTLSVSGGTDIVFTEEEAIIDITDGDDAKRLTLSSDTPIVLYDTSGEVFSVENVILRAFQSFLDGSTFYFYRDIGSGNWQELTNFKTGSITVFTDDNPTGTIVTSTAHGLINGEQINITGTTNYDGNYEVFNVTTDTFEIDVTFVADDATGSWNQDFYTTTNQQLSFATDDIFKKDGNKENKRFIVTTADDPLNAEDSDQFYDIFTISKLSSTGLGAPGADAYTVALTNEVDTAVLDRATLLPQSGEIYDAGPPIDYGTVTTEVKVFKGTDLLVLDTDYTITGVTSSDGDISFAVTAGGLIYINTWTATDVRKVTGVITINITGVGDIVKNFVVSTSLDSEGALIPYINIDSSSVNKSLAFTPGQREDITLEAVLDQNGTKILASDWDGNAVWFFGNVNSGTGNTSGTNDVNKKVTREDVNGSLSVKAQIVYNGKTYTTTPINIDDVSDSKQYISYHRYAGAIPSEPISIPTKPNDISVAAFDALGSNDVISNSFYKSSNLTTYWYSLGIVNNVGGTDTIIWGTPIRNRGEKGDQGPTPDFVVTMYKANNTGVTPTFPASNADRQAMLDAGWFFTPAETTGSIIYSASNTFDGAAVNNLTTDATGNWKATRVTGTTGPQGSGIQTYKAGRYTLGNNNSKHFKIAQKEYSNSGRDDASLKLAISGDKNGGAGFLDINVGFLNGIQNGFEHYQYTGTSPSEIYNLRWRRQNSVLELWIELTTHTIGTYFSVLHEFSTVNEWEFFNNEIDSGQASAPSSSNLISKIRINDLNDDVSDLLQTVNSLDNDVSGLLNDNNGGTLKIIHNIGGLDDLEIDAYSSNGSVIDTITTSTALSTTVSFGASKLFIANTQQEQTTERLRFFKMSTRIFQNGIAPNTSFGLKEFNAFKVNFISPNISSYFPVITQDLAQPLTQKAIDLDSVMKNLDSDYYIIANDLSYIIGVYQDFESGAQGNRAVTGNDGLLYYFNGSVYIIIPGLTLEATASSVGGKDEYIESIAIYPVLRNLVV